MDATNPIESRQQGVTYASLRSTLPVAHFVRAQGGSRVEHNECVRGGRIHCVSSRLNADELSALKSDARASHKRMGALLRNAYFGSDTIHVPAVNVVAWERLASMMDDLHALTVKVNAGQLSDQLRPLMTATIEALNTLQDGLIGTNGGDHER
jgi:hypothetical protein